MTWLKLRLFLIFLEWVLFEASMCFSSALMFPLLWFRETPPLPVDLNPIPAKFLPLPVLVPLKLTLSFWLDMLLKLCQPEPLLRSLDILRPMLELNTPEWNTICYGFYWLE